MSGLHVHVGGGVERRTAHHQEQAAIREAIESGTAATVVPGRAVLLTVVALPAASVDVHEDAPNYGRPKTVCEWKKKASERKRAKAMREWQRGAHLPGAVEAVETAEESSDGGGGGVAPALPGRKQSALSASFLQQAAAEGAGVRGRDAAGAYAEPARDGIEQLAALSSQAGARVFGRVRGQRRRSHYVRRGRRRVLPH